MHAVVAIHKPRAFIPGVFLGPTNADRAKPARKRRGSVGIDGLLQQFRGHMIESAVNFFHVMGGFP